jgi:hypothetical protein
MFSTNVKTNLCKNVINNNRCTYGEKCKYAHSLTEQKIKPNRKKTLELLEKGKELDNISPEIVDELKIFTKICEKCINNNCIGGLNCLNGCISAKFQICENDLYNGICDKTNCELIHPTKRGLKPINLWIDETINKIITDGTEFDSKSDVKSEENLELSDSSNIDLDKSIFD